MQLIKIEEEEDQLIIDKTVNCVNNSELTDHPIVTDLTFMGLIQPCPYSEIKVINESRTLLKNTWPSGKYKIITTIMDDRDDKIFEVIYYEESTPELRP